MWLSEGLLPMLPLPDCIHPASITGLPSTSIPYNFRLPLDGLLFAIPETSHYVYVHSPLLYRYPDPLITVLAFETVCPDIPCLQIIPCSCFESTDLEHGSLVACLQRIRWWGETCRSGHVDFRGSPEVCLYWSWHRYYQPLDCFLHWYCNRSFKVR